MKIKREIIMAKGFSIPCVLLEPSVSHGATVVVHGYGGCKEEQLGLAWRIAGAGMTTCVIDHRGHGEHELPLNENVSQDVETAITYCRHFGKVAAIGHSSGGRLCLTSSADFAVGISPALSTAYTPETQRLISNMRGYRVRESYPGVNFELLRKAPVPQHLDNSRTLLLFGSRDVPEIVSSCKEFKAKGNHVVEIDGAFHNDIFLLEESFEHVVTKLREWFGKDSA